ncbi:MAG TPA: hypothetical protein VJ464_17410 [Blastocatellia bacterium]|nr:hypothetical protein [Blastocatellia bacterium]
MNQNLESQYDEVISYLDRYREFAQRISNRLFIFNPNSPLRFFGLLKEFSTILKQTNPLSGRTPEFYKRWVSDIATDEEKQGEFFSILVSDYSIDSLCERLEAQFPHVDFGKIKKLHEVKKSQLTRFNATQVIGAILAVATALLKSVPADVVKQYIPYERFESFVFWVTVVALTYLVLVMLPIWIKYSKAKRVHQSAGDVMAYMVIKRGEKGE